MSDKDIDDDKLFQEAMGDVRPLKGKNSNVRYHQHKKQTSVPESTLKTRREAAEESRSGGGAALSEAWIEPLEPEQKIEFSKPGIQHTRLRQLRQGMVNIQFQLDLHGYKIDEAREIVFEFLQVSRMKSFTCVRIIHGKSHGRKERQTTLKSHVNHWLRQLPDVLAFCSAPPSEGGTGSVLVLLKRK